MTGLDSDLVTVRRLVRASPATVFSFFTDPQRWLSWQGVDATIEPRPGGLFRMNVRGDGYAVGRFVEVDPPRRIVFSWGWEMPGNPVPPGSSTVEIDLEPDGDCTVVRLTHRGLPPPARSVHEQGWSHYVARLAQAAAGTDPGPDPWRAPLRVVDHDELG
jgi:uncharacterized protein YndB with AHSA1/START domain